MIKFACEHCGQKIRVADEAAGKKGRCPKCKQEVTVPELALQDLAGELKLKMVDSAVSEPALPTITLVCPMCQNKLEFPQTDKGKIKECLHCTSFIEVTVPESKSMPDVDDPIRLQPKPDVQDDYVDNFNRQPIKTEETAPQPPKRLLPFFLDIFLYPFNMSGLLSLIGFVSAPVLLYPVIFLGCYGSLLYLGLMLCLTAYIFWYFSLCIQRSAEGQVRAPDSFMQDANMDLWDMFLQMLRTILLIIVCLLPAFIYLSVTKNSNAIFYAMLAGSIFFLPMMLLASVMFDSFWAAWNPRVIIGGMFSSFLGYLGLVITFYIPISIYFYIEYLSSQQENIVLPIVLNACSLYMIMVSSHLLGWFFYRNEEKLYWNV